MAENDNDNDDAEDYGGGRPSKSARKRDAESLQELGVELAELPAEEIAALELPEKLETALIDLKRLPTHGAQFRQRQFIGKLMRRIDPAPIIAQLEAKKRTHDLEVRHFQKIERWRERLLTEPDAAAQFLAEHPEADARELRRLIAQAAHERGQQRAPAAARELFAFLRRQQGW